MRTLDKTIQALQTHKGDWVNIANKADVSYSWLTKLANNKIPNPGITTIEKLNSILRKAA